MDKGLKSEDLPQSSAVSDIGGGGFDKKRGFHFFFSFENLKLLSLAQGAGIAQSV